LNETLALSLFVQKKLLATLLVILLAGVLRWIVNLVFVDRIKDPKSRYQWRKTTAYLFTFLGAVFIIGLWLDAGQSLLTYFGLISAALVVALQDPISNIVGWAFILWRKPFEVGDRIQIDGNSGDVIDMRLFQFTLMEIGNWVDADQSTGRILHIPNKTVFNSVLANFSKGSDYIWNELPVLITFESDWRLAKRLLQSITDQHVTEIEQEAEASFQKAARQYLLQYNKLTPKVYTSVRESGILLTIRYLSEPKQRRDTEERIWEGILEVFSQHDQIDFAYPTQRFYNNLVEGRTNLDAYLVQQGDEK
jgi:small-conductance mechanosensitive channel